VPRTGQHHFAKALAAFSLMFMMFAPARAHAQQGYTFRGIIIIPASHHDENFEVLLTNKDGEQIIAFMNADISSRYTFAGLSSGYFDIVIRLNGFKESRTHVRAGFESVLAPTGIANTIYDVNILLEPDDSAGNLANEQAAYTKALLEEYGKGLEEMSRKHPDLALPHLEKVVKEIPDFYDGHFNLGLVYQDLSRRAEAATEYRKAHELNPNSARPFLVLGRLFLEEADIEILSATNADTGIKLKVAREALMEAIMRDPKLGTAFYYLGAVDFRSQSYADHPDQCVCESEAMAGRAGQCGYLPAGIPDIALPPAGRCDTSEHCPPAAATAVRVSWRCSPYAPAARCSSRLGPGHRSCDSCRPGCAEA
jgi:tetratricopeptide (TPR) repeat protein